MLHHPHTPSRCCRGGGQEGRPPRPAPQLPPPRQAHHASHPRCCRRGGQGAAAHAAPHAGAALHWAAQRRVQRLGPPLRCVLPLGRPPGRVPRQAPAHALPVTPILQATPPTPAALHTSLSTPLACTCPAHPPGGYGFGYRPFAAGYEDAFYGAVAGQPRWQNRWDPWCKMGGCQQSNVGQPNLESGYFDTSYYNDMERSWYAGYGGVSRGAAENLFLRARWAVGLAGGGWDRRLWEWPALGRGVGVACS